MSYPSVARRYRRQGMGGAIIIVLALLCLIGGCAAYVSEYSSPDTKVLHITGKESVNTSEGHEYRVYAEEDTYVIKDSILWTRFNSSNVYSKLKVPQNGGRAIPYRCEVAGFRIPLFSQFENIKDCEPL